MQVTSLLLLYLSKLVVRTSFHLCWPWELLFQSLFNFWYSCPTYSSCWWLLITVNSKISDFFRMMMEEICHRVHLLVTCYLGEVAAKIIAVPKWWLCCTDEITDMNDLFPSTLAACYYFRWNVIQCFVEFVS